MQYFLKFLYYSRLWILFLLRILKRKKRNGVSKCFRFQIKKRGYSSNCKINLTHFFPLGCHSRIESSHSIRLKDAKLQTTHLPSTFNVRMSNLRKIDVYNFGYIFSVGILMKLFFLSHKCINK